MLNVRLPHKNIEETINIFHEINLLLNVVRFEFCRFLPFFLLFSHFSLNLCQIFSVLLLQTMFIISLIDFFYYLFHNKTHQHHVTTSGIILTRRAFVFSSFCGMTEHKMLFFFYSLSLFFVLPLLPS